jgi:hypothetical protein
MSLLGATILTETRWEPKKVFHAMAARYERR